MIKINKETRGIIFDLDGVITDTSEYHYLSWKKLADRLDIPFDRKKNEQFRGVSRIDCLEILLEDTDKEYTEEDKKELATEKNNYYRVFLQQLSTDNILPGVIEIINKAEEKEIKIAIASSSKNAETVVSNLGIKERFNVIADGYSVENTKPAPDIFIYTANKMELSPGECIVIEDAESGIEAALKAGMIAVGVGPEERFGKADYRFDKVDDIDIDLVINN